jgi:hypothetical protein
MLIQTNSLLEFHDGKYDLVNELYYEQMHLLFKETKYAAIADFYLKRNHEIMSHIMRHIKGNQGKTIVIITGADHRSFILKMLQQQTEVPLKLR